MLKYLKRQAEIRLRKWCLEIEKNGSTPIKSADELYEWLTIGGRKKINLRKYAYRNSFKISGSYNDRDRLVRAKCFYDWLIGNDF